jgi:hypothetical protein
MTMFTPPGEGGRRRRSRGRRTAFTLVLAIVLLAGAVWVAWDYLLKDEPTTAARPACTPTAPATAPAPHAAVVPANKVAVNVYNSTDRRGLAGSVATELKKRKFAVKKVANDPLKRKVPGVAEIRHGKAGAAAARTLAAQLPGAELVLDRRKDGGVDLALGEKFSKLATPQQAAANLKPAPVSASPTPTC